jgi:hypothetical protein
MTAKSAGMLLLTGLFIAMCSCAPVTIETDPAGAAVYDASGQTQLGTTPYKTSIFLGEKNFTVRKPCYIGEPVKLDCDSARTVDVNLRPIPVFISSTPAAEIYAQGSETPIGRTPVKINMPEHTQGYTLKAKDYFDEPLTIGPETTGGLTVKMKRRPIVTLSSSPDGAEVYEKGTLIGTAPVIEEIAAARTFELRKAGHLSKTVTLTEAPPYEVTVELKPFPVITVEAVPAAAQIYRGGSSLGKAPAQVTVGEKVSLEVRADRFYPQTVTLTPDSSAKVSVALKPMPYVMINSDPAGAELCLKDKVVGQTPVEQVVEKEAVYELRKEGYQTKTVTLSGAEKLVTVKLDLIPPPVVTPEPALPAEVAAAPVAKKSGSKLFWIAAIPVAIAALILIVLKKRKKS